MCTDFPISKFVGTDFTGRYLSACPVPLCPLIGIQEESGPQFRE